MGLMVKNVHAQERVFSWRAEFQMRKICVKGKLRACASQYLHWGAKFHI